MTEQPQSSSHSLEEDTEGHKRRFADEDSTEGEEDTEGHGRRSFADQESTEGESED